MRGARESGLAPKAQAIPCSTSLHITGQASEGARVDDPSVAAAENGSGHRMTRIPGASQGGVGAGASNFALQRPELALCQQVEQAGGSWNPDRKVRELRYDHAIVVGREARSCRTPDPREGRASDCRCRDQGGRSIYPQMPTGIQV